MSTASMSFGRPTRVTFSRGNSLFAGAAHAVIQLLRRIDRWQLRQAEQGPKTPDEVLAWARHVESSDPGFAADLRAAALRTQSRDER